MERVRVLVKAKRVIHEFPTKLRTVNRGWARERSAAEVEKNFFCWGYIYEK